MNQNNFNELLLVADRHYSAGQPESAIPIYNHILAQEPKNPHANYMMAVIGHRVRSLDMAEKYARQAISGQSAQKHLHYKILGDILRDNQNLAAAIENYRLSVEAKPDFTEGLNNLGTALMFSGKSDEALSCYEKVLAIDPQNFLALYNAATIHESLQNTESAKSFYLRTISINPNIPEAHNNLGNILKASGDPEGAITHYREALKIRKNYPEAAFNLGNALSNQKEYEKAIEAYVISASLHPTSEVFTSLGCALQKLDRLEEAVASYERALALDPRNLEALNNIGSAYIFLKKYEAATKFFERALAIDPHHAQAINNMGNLCKSFNDVDKAISYYRQASSLMPGNERIYANILLAMVYSPSVAPEELYETAMKYGETIANNLLRRRELRIDFDLKRKLRIGYISPDFRTHPVSYFFEPLLRNHDRRKFEIFGYGSVISPDHITDRIKSEFDHWRDIRHADDDKAADIIEADKIDILIDLSGHTADNRLLVMARKPAPIQVSWLGYPATTGMKAMDYRITDPYCEPEGMTEHLNIEKLWRLPQIFCCYGGHESNPVVIDHPPHDDNGYITFGCFNNFSKVSDLVLATWAQIMNRVPNARLLLEIEGLGWQEWHDKLVARIQEAGLPMDRVMLEPRKKSNQFVLYNKIDIALDPFPCVGGTTSMDTIWMGVPFITLAGNSFASRMGVSILTNVGLPELIAENLEAYVEKAVALANDKERLTTIRKNLRGRALTSPLMDQKAFARNMEEAYHGMWREFCAGNHSKP